MSGLDTQEPSWEVMPTPGSSNISEARFDKTTDTLEVDFQNGSSYVYSNVSPSAWRMFQAAPSKGAFFAKSIRNRYPFEQV
jgi:lysyl-tRNA synthetase class 2